MNLLYSIWGLRKLILIIQNIYINLRYNNISNTKIKIFGIPIISVFPKSHIQIGKNIILISASYFSEPGINHPVIIRTLNENAELSIGDNVGISGGGISCANKVIIGNNVMFGANAFVTDTDFHPIKPNNRRFEKENTLTAPVIIEDNVFLGMNVLVLKGVKIGKNSIIAAGSIVTSDIEDNCIAAGIPAKKIKTLINDETHISSESDI